jgi:hypothetical protein
MKTRMFLGLIAACGLLLAACGGGGAPLPTGTGQATAYQYSGTVPSGTRYVVFGGRAGQEGCDLLGARPAEFLLTDFTLDAGAAGRLSLDFTNGLPASWGTWGNAAAPQVEGVNLHVLVAPGQSLGFNSLLPLPLAAAAAPYAFTVRATIPLGSVGGGCVIAVFLDAATVEITRAVIPIVP